MTQPTQDSLRNFLLRAASAEDFAAISPALRRFDLKQGETLIRPNETIDSVCFVEVGLASVISVTPKGRRIEAGLVGREGFVGAPLLFGTDRSPLEFIVQIPGEALAITTSAFLAALGRQPGLRTLLLSFVQTFMIQTAQTALANGILTIEERLARWMLMCHDRVDGDSFPVTHEFLSIMLAVHRPGVTLAIHALEAAGLVKATRGSMTILDRDRLKKMSGEVYGVPEAEYARLIGPPWRRR